MLGLGTGFYKLGPVSPSFYTKRNSRSIRYDGGGDYVEFDRTFADNDSGFTVSMWVYLLDKASVQILFDTREGSGDGWAVYINTNEKVNFIWESTNLAQAGSSVREAWALVTASRAADGTMKLYINANSPSTATDTDDAEQTGTAKLGRKAWESAQDFAGFIDEFAYWNTVLDADDIAAIHAGAGDVDLTGNFSTYDKADNLVEYLRFEEGNISSTSITNDSFEYNDDPTITHDGTLTIVAGMEVSGTGIPEHAFVHTVTDSTHFELSHATTGGSLDSQGLTFTTYDPQTGNLTNEGRLDTKCNAALAGGAVYSTFTPTS